MHFFLEIVLVVIGLGLALGMLERSLRPALAVIATIAWIPVWIFTHILWHPATGHHSALGYPWWFWLIFGIALAAYVVSFLPRVRITFVARLLGVALVVIAMFFVSWFGPTVTNKSTGKTTLEGATPSASPTPTPTPTTSPVACQTWKMAETTPSNGRWAANGVPAIASATTKPQAQAAAVDWINQVKVYPGTLSGAVAYLLGQTVDPSTLVDAKGCATTKAVNLVQESSVALALSEVTPSQAPATGVNTLTSNGRVYAEASAGVTGNRKAIEIVTKDGNTFWVMARCGNPVTLGKAPIPAKPLPQPSPTPSTPPCVPGQYTASPPPGYNNYCLEKKNPSQGVMNNPSVPPQVKGPGTTQIGTSPGPATKPTDSGTGCYGPCPGSTAEPHPSSSPTEAPPTPQPRPTPIASDPTQTSSVPPPPPPAS